MTAYEMDRSEARPSFSDRLPSDFPAVMTMIGLLWFGLLAGFVPDTLHKLSTGRSYALVIHAHAFLAVTWMSLLTWQALQAGSGRLVEHQRNGRIGRWAALALVTVSVPAAFVSDVAHMHAPGFVGSRLALQYVHLVVFAVLTLAAFLNTRHPDAHKRLLLMGVVAIMDAGFSRWLGEGVVGMMGEGPLTEWALRYPLSLGLLALMGGYDLATRGRLHPVFVPAALLIFTSQIFALWLYYWPPFQTMTARLFGLA
jgi:hypothetical protein